MSIQDCVATASTKGYMTGSVTTTSPAKSSWPQAAALSGAGYAPKCATRNNAQAVARGLTSSACEKEPRCDRTHLRAKPSVRICPGTPGTKRLAKKSGEAGWTGLSGNELRTSGTVGAGTMKKIPTLFERDATNRKYVTPDTTPGLEYILTDGAIATRKYDGTACLVRDNRLYKRYDAKAGKTPPPEFEPAQPEPDEVTGHWPGWLPVTAGDKWHMEAWNGVDGHLPDGTYELCGPKIQGNPEGFMGHVLIKHGGLRIRELSERGLTFTGLAKWMQGTTYEGVVWWKDGEPVAKLKKRDFPQ